MADSLISLSDEKLSTRYISSAVKSLKKAKDTLDKISTDTAKSGSTEDCDGVKIFLCVSGDFETARANAEKLQAILEDCESILKSGPETLRETDKSFKGQFDPDANGKWKDIRDRIINAAIFGVVPAYTAYIGLQGLFSSKSQKTQVETISAPVEPIIPDVESVPTISETEIYLDDYESGAGVQKGRIRWVYQGSSGHSWDEQTERQKRIANGWGDKIGISGGQCNSACQSMALSYMGIDMSPGSLPNHSILDGAAFGTAEKTWDAPDGTKIKVNNFHGCNVADIDNRVEAFKNDGNVGNTSPVMIRYQNGSSGHWIVITGKNANGTYNAIGPQYGERPIIISITDTGYVSQVPDPSYPYNHLSHGGGTIERYEQYTRTSDG